MKRLKNNNEVKDPGTIAERNNVYILRNLLYNFLINFVVISLLVIIVGLVVFATTRYQNDSDYTDEMAAAETDALQNIESFYNNEAIPNGYFLIGYNSFGAVDKKFCDYDRFKSGSLTGNYELNYDETKVYNGHNYRTRLIKLSQPIKSLTYVRILYQISDYNASTIYSQSAQIALYVTVIIISIAGALFLAFIQVMQNHKSQLAINKFASDISHELNTPLSIIQSNLQSLLEEPTMTIADGSSKLVCSTSEVTRLRKMSKQLLTLSRCDNAKLKIECKPHNLVEEMERILEPYQLIAEMQNKEFEIYFDADIPNSLTFDKDLMVQILTALLDNAIKYTMENEKIKVRFNVKQNILEFAVSDNGAGVEEHDLDKIFNRFYRTEKSRTSEGSGLGLSIVHAIVVALNGKILAKNLKPRGFEVQITLPLKTKKAKIEKANIE